MAVTVLPRVKHVLRANGTYYTDVWLDGMYSRFGGIIPRQEAFAMVRVALQTHPFRD